MKRFIIKWLFRLLDSSFKIDYKQIDKKAWEEWAFGSFDNKGWRSYFAYQDLKILKELSFGKDRDAYMILIGRRIQLLYLFDEMRRAVESRISLKEKQKSKEEGEK